MRWSKCADGFAYKGVPTEHTDLFTEEYAFYVDLSEGVVWHIQAHRGDRSTLVRATSLKQHPETIEELKIPKAFTALAIGLMEHQREDGPLWMESLPEDERDAMLEAMLDVTEQLDSQEQIPWHYEKRVLAGEAYRVLEDHGIYC